MPTSYVRLPAGMTAPGGGREVACHGATGDGDGPLAMYLTVAPRSFLREPYKWRSTRSGWS